jgi:hypothetical protein
MNAYLAVVFVENIQTDELCHYVAEGSDSSGNVKLLGKKQVSHHGTSHEQGGIRKDNTTHERGPPPLTPMTS